MALKTKAKSGFVYKPRTATQIKERATRKSSRFDSIYKPGVDTYRSKQGDNLFRYLPPTWDDSDHYGYTIFTHFGIGPDNSTYLCLRKMLNKPCPICEAQKEAKDAGENDEASKLNYSERIVSYIIDRDADDPEKPLVFEQSWTQDRDVVSLCMNERTGEILMIDHPDNGFDVSFKKTGAGLRTKYYGYQIARDASPIHDSEKAQDEILEFVKENPIPELLNFYDYDYLKGVLSGAVPEKDQAVDESEDEEVQTPPKRNAKPARNEEVDEEDVEEKPTARRNSARRQVEEEPPFEEPVTRRGPRRDQEVDEEVDEEAEETPVRRGQTVSASRSNGRARVVEEDDEEDAPPPPRAARASVRGR